MNIEQVKALRHGTEIYHKTATNADGSAIRARVNGAFKQPARTPDAWRRPMKYGLYQCFDIDASNVDDWTMTDPAH